ncbi:serine carboxypeptidase domain-containing protein [Phthorimaea operculella]|nr:serine carboxypeptidase domain-containing protein [Phthorimaea operculella]
MDLVSMGFLLVLSLVSVLHQAESVSPPLFLTPLINQNKAAEARNRSAVNPALFLNVTSHAGFLTVDPEKNSNTFFWYFPVEGEDVGEAPWIIWLQGGPGASSLAGLFDEIGPFEYKDGQLNRRKHAWTNNHSVLFIDNPIGVGYSFTEKEDGFATKMEEYATHLYNATQQFLTIFPELRNAPLFLAGESYAGRYVPALAARIEAADEGMQVNQPPITLEWISPLFLTGESYDGRYVPALAARIEAADEGMQVNQPPITLEGIILGNPVLNREDIVNITNAFYQWGLIDSDYVETLRPLEKLYLTAIEEGNSALAAKTREDIFNKLSEKTMQNQAFNLLADDSDYDKIYNYKEFLAKEEIKDALHVGERPYIYHNDTVANKLIPDFLMNSSAIVMEILNKYKVLIYCGQLDLTAPCVPSAEARRTTWNWTKHDDFLKAPRVPWWYETTVAGYIKKGGGLEEALVRGAGHLAPMDKPAEVLVLISSFIKNIEMELPPNYLVETPPPHQTNTTIYITNKPEVIPSYITDDEVKTTNNVTMKPEVTNNTTNKTKVTTTKPAAANVTIKNEVTNTTVKPEVTTKSTTIKPEVTTKEQALLYPIHG